MEEQDTASPGPVAGEPRPSLKQARLALITTLGALILVGAMLTAGCVLFAVALGTEWHLDYFLPALSSALGAAAFIVCLLIVLCNHRRGAPAGLAQASVMPIMLAGLLISASIAGRGSGGGSLFLVPSFGSVIFSVYLLYARTKRLRLSLGNQPAPADAHHEVVFWIGSGAAWICMAIGVFLAVNAITFNQSFPDEGLVSSGLIPSGLMQRLAVSLLVPLTLMASDAYLLLRQRLRQEEQLAP